MKAVYLISPEDQHDPIRLPHLSPIAIGRSPETKIIDKRCSRHQLELIANCETGEVSVKQLGSNNSALDGIEMTQGKTYKMKLKSVLYVLTGLYPQKLKCVEKRKSGDSGNSKMSNKSTNNGKVSGDTCSTREGVKSENRKRSLEDSDTDSQVKKFKTSEKSEKGSGKIDKFVRKTSKEEASSDAQAKDIKSQKKMDNSDNSDDEGHLKSVAEKLKMLKESAKTIKSPLPVSSGGGLGGAGGSGRVGTPAARSQWQQHETLYVFTGKGVQAREKIAGFDIDGTIITTQSGKVFPTHTGDWKIMYSEIPKKLKKMHDNGYKIVFFTNQMGVSRGKQKIQDLKEKFSNVVDKVGIPVQIFVSTTSGIYRKPALGMWNFLLEKGNDGIPVDVSRSVYVGDAAGRPEKWAPKKKKDFSCSDRLFAMNIGVRFQTPEEFFLGYKEAPYKIPEFDPRKLKSSDQLLHPSSAQLTTEKQELVILCGYPASGKSFFAKTYMIPKGYVHINRDTLGTWQKCVKASTEALKAGKSVVVDNTNPDAESRARYLQSAKAVGVPCRCFVFTASAMQARHNERFREMTDKSHQPINDMIMNSFKGKYTLPEMKEGFSEIVKVNLVPKFTNKDHEKLYRQFLLEK